MKYLISCGLVAALALAAFHPNPVVIRGIVIDSVTRQPVAAALVTIKGTRRSVRTAADGSFSIAASDANVVLVCEGPGFARLEKPWKAGDRQIAFELIPSSDSLDEVVVKGFRAENKKEVFLEPIAASPVSPRNEAPQGLLQGRVAGVSIGRTRASDKVAGYPRASDFNTEEYDGIAENRFLRANDNPLSTFSIDVDGASYSNTRRFLNEGQAPPAGAVRIEELINYFHYDYPQPAGEDPFSINAEVAACPWSPDHRLVMIGLQGKKIATDKLPASNLVFLIDVSGSMDEPNKLPLVQASLRMLADQLREQDRVSIVVYAGNAGLVLPATHGSNKQAIRDAIDRLEAGGSTAGGEGIRLAYATARREFIAGGNNRVILCTDGDFNVGASSDAELEKLIEKERRSGVTLSVLGFGMGNYKDSKMQKLADKGNGNHNYIDNLNEAKKVLVTEFGGTLFTIAKDVKLQLEFNPAAVAGYRLIGYENRLLNKEDFNDDKKDAGDLGSGHTVTALYEIIPAGVESPFLADVDPLKYQKKPARANQVAGGELLTVKFRYKKPGEETSRLLQQVVNDRNAAWKSASENFRFVCAVAEFGMSLTESKFLQEGSLREATQLARGALGSDAEGYRAEFLTLIRKAESVMAHTDKPGSSEDEAAGSR